MANTFTALGHDGVVSVRILADGTLERLYRVRVGLEVFEYCDTIPKADFKSAAGRVGELRHRAVVRRIEVEMRKRGVKPKVQPSTWTRSRFRPHVPARAPNRPAIFVPHGHFPPARS